MRLPEQRGRGFPLSLAAGAESLSASTGGAKPGVLAAFRSASHFADETRVSALWSVERPVGSLLRDDDMSKVSRTY